MRSNYLGIALSIWIFRVHKNKTNKTNLGFADILKDYTTSTHVLIIHQFHSVSPFFLRVFTEPLDEAFESHIVTIKVASLEKINGNKNMIQIRKFSVKATYCWAELRLLRNFDQNGFSINFYLYCLVAAAVIYPRPKWAIFLIPWICNKLYDCSD